MESAPANAGASAHERLLGRWRYHSVELPHAPADQRAALRTKLTQGSIVFEKDRFTSYAGEKVFESKAYRVVKQADDAITIAAEGDEEETYTFQGDDELVMNHGELGRVVMKRQ